MKTYGRTLLALLCILLVTGSAWGQTNPTAQSLPYSQDFGSVAHSSTTYPPGWQGWRISTSPGSSFSTSGPTLDQALIASSTAATTSGNVHNYNGKIGFLNGASLDLTQVLAINTTGWMNVSVSYDIMTIRNPYDGTSNTRINEITVQYRIGISGSWTTLTGIEYQNNTTLQTGSVTTPQNPQTKSVALPAQCGNQSVVQVRWASRQVSGAGSRPSFAVDNVSVTGTLIPLQFRSASSGNWNSTSTWQQSNDGGTWTAATSTPTSADSSITIQSPHVVTVTAPVTVDDVTINAGGEVIANAALTIANGTGTDMTVNGTLSAGTTITNNGLTQINGTFKLNSGGWATGANAFTYGGSGTLVFASGSVYGVGGDAYWPASSGPVNVTVNSGSGINMSVTRTISGTLATAGQVTGTALTLNGVARINGGGYFSTAPSYGGSSTLEYNTGGTYGRNDEWRSTTPASVHVTNNTTLNYPNSGGTLNTGAQTLAGNLTIDPGSALYMDYGAPSPGPGILTVNGNVTADGGLSLGNQVGGDLHIGGNWSRTGSFNPNSRAVEFLGTGTQNLTGATTFDYLTVNKSGGSLALDNGITVNNALTLTSGIVFTGSNSLALASGATASRTGGHVNGNVEKSFGTGTQSFTYPIGDASNYTPVLLNNFGVTVAGAVMARTTAGEHPNIGTSGIDQNKNVNRYWSLTKDGTLAFSSYDATFTFVGGDIDGGANTSAFQVEKYNGSWSSLTAGTRTGTTTQATGVTSFSDFIVGEPGVGPLDHFLVEAAGGGSIGTQVAGTPFSIRITAQDASNNTVTAFTGTVNITSSGTLSSGGGTTASFVNGVLTSHSVTISNTGSFTITATETGDTPTGTSNSFTVNPGALSNFLVEAAGGGAIGTQAAGTPFSIKVTARDALNNTVTGFTGTVDITSLGTLSGGSGTTVAFIAGVLSSHAVTISNTGNFTVTATQTGNSPTGTSNSFTVNAGALASFLVEAAGGGAIGTQTAGTPFSIKVTARDALNNTVTGFTGTVDITSSGSLSAGSGTTSSFAAGVLSSHAVTISNTGNFTVTATQTGNSPTGTSNSFNVNAGALNNFLVEASGGGAIGTQTAGTPFSIKVTARDASNNTVTGFSGTVNVSSTGALSSGAGTTLNFSSGVLASHSVTISNTGSFTISVINTLGAESGTSNSFTVDAGAVNSFLVEAAGGGVIGTQTAGTPFNIKVTALDALNNTVTGFTGTVNISSSGTLSGGGGTTTSFTAGVLSSHAVTISNTGTFTITATKTGDTPSGTSNSFAVNAGALANFLVESAGGGAIPSQDAGVPFSIKVTARDALNNTVTGFTGSVDITSSGSLSSGSGTTAGFIAGVLASHAVTISNAGTFDITATETGGSIVGTSNSFVVNAGGLNNFLVEAVGGGAIGTQVAGTPFNIRITARDASNNTVTGFTGTVDITSTGLLSAGGGTTASFVAGILASHAVTISNTGSFDITAMNTFGAQSGTSNVFAVNAGALDNFLVEAAGGGAIGTQTAGTPFNIRVTARDANNNIVTGFTGTVGITSSGTLSGGSGTTAAFAAGILASHAVTVSNTGNFTITATNTLGAQNGTSNSFTVNAGALDNFLVEAAGGGAIGTQTAGTPFNVQVTARDANNNTVTGFTGTVDITSSGSLSGGGGTSVAFAAGILASHAVTVSNTGSFTITATNTLGAQNGTSNSFTVNAGALDNFLVEAAGGGAIGTQTAGTPFNIQVTARDANNNTVTGFTGTVDITSSGSLSGGSGTTGAFSAGILASHAVTISNTGNFTITATNTLGAQNGTSNSFTVDAGTLANFLVEASGGGAIGTQYAGTPFAIQVTARDAFNNVVTAFNGTVQITSTGTLASGSGTTVPFTAGVLASHNVTISNVGTFDITATNTLGVQTGTSNSFAVNPGVLDNFLVEASGGGSIGTQAAGVPFNITITARDAANNTVTGFTGTVNITSTGLLSAGGGTTASFVAGVLVSHAVTITNTGSFSITATNSSGPEDGTSNSFAVNPGPLASFLVEAAGGGVIGGQVAGLPFNIRITALDAFGNTVTSFGSTVNITSSGILSAGGGATASFTSGVLSSHSVTISNTGTFDISATNGSENGTSNTFAVIAGPLNNFLVEAAGGGVIPDQTGGTPFNIRLTARDAFNNTVTGFTGTVNITSTGTLLTGGGTTAAFASGVLSTHTVAISNTGAFTITATNTLGAESGASNAFNVNVGPLYDFLVEAAGGGAIGTQTAGTSFNIRLTARDAGGNTVTSFTGTVDITSSGTLLSGGGTTLAFTAGVLATHSMTITSAGSTTITATKTGDTPFGTSNAFTVDPASLSNFQVESAGGGSIPGQTAGVPFSIKVTALDTYANVVTSFAGTVDITSGGPLAAGGGTTVSFAAGVLVSHAVTINVSGPYTLTAELTGGGPSGASNAFAVGHAALSKFLVEAAGGGAITGQVAGVPFDVRITAQDAFDNTVTSFASTVNVTSGGTLLSGGGMTASFISGVLATHAVAISNTGNFSITATHSFGAENGVSNIFAVSPGPLTHYLVEAAGGGLIPGQAAGTGFNIQVTARDAFNNTVTGFTGTVDISSSGTLSSGAGTTAPFVAGFLASHGVTISNTGTFSITASTTGGAETGTSNSFLVSSGALDHFLVEASGGGAIGAQTAGIPFNIRITALDVNGNVVTGFVTTVDISSTGTLSSGGGTTGGFAAGILASHSITITNTGTFTVSATVTGGSETGVSNGFSVGAGPLDHFAVEAFGGGAIGVQTAGAPFAIRITAGDAFNNTVTSFTGTVDITATGTMLVGAGTTSAFTGGVLASHSVSFSSVGPTSLTATKTGSTETGTSNIFTVNPAPLSTFLVEAAGGGPIGTQAVALPFNIQVTARDAFGNTVTGFTGTVDISTAGALISGGGATAPFVAGFLSTHTINYFSPGNFLITAKRTGGTELGTSNLFTVSQTFLTITATTGPKGSIFPAGAVQVAYGSNRTFLISPNPGYAVDDVLVDGVSAGGVSEYTFTNVITGHTIHATFEPVSIFLSLSPDSIISQDPTTLKLKKPVRRKKGLMPNWVNLLSETVIQGGFQPDATESDEAGGMRVGISSMIEVSPDKFKPDYSEGVGWVRLTKWDFRKSVGKQFNALQKTLIDRTGTHDEPPRGFNYVGAEANPKPFIKQWTLLPPKRHNNELFAELVALKVNIAASQLGKTPIGFGELVYENDGHPCDELSIVEISAKADTAMTYWEGRPDQEYQDLFDAIYEINRAFESELDTVRFENGGQLELMGEVDLGSVPFLKMGAVPPRQLERTTDLTEIEDDFEDEEFEDGAPVAAKLYQNYPNPFNPSTTIAFRLREVSQVTMEIYNMLGQQVATLLNNEEVDEGLQVVQFNATSFASGVYFYRIVAQGLEDEALKTVETGKMLLLK